MSPNNTSTWSPSNFYWYNLLHDAICVFLIFSAMDKYLFIWYNDRYHSSTMWTHNTPKLCKIDGELEPVATFEANNIVCLNIENSVYSWFLFVKFGGKIVVTFEFWYCSYSCPVFLKSICNLSNLWRKIDQEVWKKEDWPRSMKKTWLRS
jgi:hypothetical protein